MLCCLDTYTCLPHTILHLPSQFHMKHNTENILLGISFCCKCNCGPEFCLTRNLLIFCIFLYIYGETAKDITYIITMNRCLVEWMFLLPFRYWIYVLFYRFIVVEVVDAKTIFSFLN